MTEASEFFSKTICNELELQRAIQSEQHLNLETQLREMKVDFNKEKDHFDSKLRSAEVDKAELVAIENSLRETLERLS